MSCNCVCPNSELTIIPETECYFNIKQIQKVFFQRSGNQHLFTSLVFFQSLVDATDNTKLVMSPYIGGEPTISAGELIAIGGDNSTKDGIELISGTKPTTFICKFRNLTPEQEIAFKLLMCEKNLTAYFVNQDGQMFGETVGGLYKGFNIFGFSFSDRGNNGRSTKDYFTLKFQMVACWSSKLIKLSTNFNALTDLVEPQNYFVFDNDNNIIFDNDNYATKD